MKIGLFFFVMILLLTGCTVNNKTPNDDQGKTYLSEIDLLADLVCDDTKKVTPTDVEKFLTENVSGQLGKWVFCDYYADTTTDVAVTTQVSTTETTNAWGCELWGGVNHDPETGYYVSGIFKNTVRFIFKNMSTNKFHVYEYLKYGSDYGTKNVWFGDTHIMYFNPVNNGMILCGAPYLEIFPDLVNNDILELRIEKTSFFKYRGIYAGNESDDPGSTEEEMFVHLGQADTENVDVMKDENWKERNKYFTINSNNSAYIHYSDNTKKLNARIFLGKYIDGNMRIQAIYLQDFSKN